MTDIEKIEADLKSIADAQQCMVSMKSIRDDRDLMMDFRMMWMDMKILSENLRIKLEKLKHEGGSR